MQFVAGVSVVLRNAQLNVINPLSSFWNVHEQIIHIT